MQHIDHLPCFPFADFLSLLYRRVATSSLITSLHVLGPPLASGLWHCVGRAQQKSCRASFQASIASWTAAGLSLTCVAHAPPPPLFLSLSPPVSSISSAPPITVSCLYSVWARAPSFKSARVRKRNPSPFIIMNLNLDIQRVVSSTLPPVSFCFLQHCTIAS